MTEYICKEVQTDNGGYIEPVKELIRCRDCKYHYYHELLKQDYCEVPNMQFGEVEPNGYCHRAERKED